MSETKPEFFWTTHPDEFWTNGPYFSRDEALAAGRADHPGVEIHTGILDRAKLEDMIPDGDDVLDHMKNAAHDAGDIEGQWLSFIPRESIEKLGALVAQVVKAWVDEVGDFPSFGRISEIEVHPPMEKES